MIGVIGLGVWNMVEVFDMFIFHVKLVFYRLVLRMVKVSLDEWEDKE